MKSSDMPDPFDPPTQLTPEEKTRIEKLAIVEMRASNGDPEASKKLAEINVALNNLARRAKKGDTKAARILATLAPTGLVQQIAATSKKGKPRLAMAGGLGEEEITLAMEGGACERAALRRRL